MTEAAEAPAQDQWAHNMTWLVRLRWLAVLGQAGAVLVADRLMHLPLSTRWLYALVALTATSNVGCTVWLTREPTVREWMLAALMAADFVLLTALLQASGGPSNPFTVLYLVHIALAAVVLRPVYAWALALLSAACFGALFVLPESTSAMAMAMSSMHAGHDHSQMSLHLQGMWIAFALAAAAISYFVTRVTRDLAAQRSAAARERTRALRSEKLASLATLAAGAAHELATPLGTIAVVAKELERELATGSQAEDARLIREEVQRCKQILEQMASDAGESAGEAFVEVSARALIDAMLQDLPERERIELMLDDSARLYAPTRALARALRGLLRNALQASREPVKVTLRAQQQKLVLSIEDHGSGMTAAVLERVGEPFFSTKPLGQGMGLGVFLARALCERLGGGLEIDSVPGRGTSVRVVLPQGSAEQHRLETAAS